VGVPRKATSVTPKTPKPRPAEDTEDTTEEGFQTVTSKRKLKRKREIDELDFYRNKKLDKIFLVEVGREGTVTIKKNLWSEIVERVQAPKVKDTRVLPRGDITIKLPDEATYKVLQDIQKGCMTSVFLDTRSNFEATERRTTPFQRRQGP